MKERLYRSRQERVIGGVCAGLGDYLNLDPVLMRVILVILAFINGLGILLYIILWIVVKEEPYNPPYVNNSEADTSTEKSEVEEDQEKDKIKKEEKSSSGRTIFGIILISIGFLLLVENYIPHLDFVEILPFILIIFGLVLVWNSARK